MTETDFRTKHSEVIGYYQCIEIHLKGICATLLANEDRSWIERLDDYETDTMGKMLQQIQTIQAQKHLNLFSSEDFEALDKLRKRRNYWIHQCFIDYSHVTFKKGEVRNPLYEKQIMLDLIDAMEWDEKLVEIAHSI